MPLIIIYTKHFEEIMPIYLLFINFNFATVLTILLLFHLFHTLFCPLCVTHAGLAMSQIELEKIADHFDRDKDGYIDLSKLSSQLRGQRRARSLTKEQPVSDSGKIDLEVIIIIILRWLP